MRFTRCAAAMASASLAWLVQIGGVQAAPFELGGWLGTRGFSDNSLLGYLDGAPEHLMLRNSVVFGARFARPIFPWLVPELELALSPTKTDRYDVNVLWLNPRAQLRVMPMPHARLRPFLVIGGGGPVSLSAKRGLYATSIVGDAYAGGGVIYATPRNFDIRFDVRASLMPGVDPMYTPEWEAGIGLSFRLGGAKSKHAGDAATTQGKDEDKDGIADGADQCPDRAEDVDGFEDRDGCPDIDNDLDQVLDIVDKCGGAQETYNGVEDQDGCPDTVPPELAALSGAIPGLLYAPGSVEIRASAQPALDNIAALLAKHPSVRIVLSGYTDESEAQPPQVAGQEVAEAEIDAGYRALAEKRATEVRKSLVALGVTATRIDVEAHGRDNPVAENDTPKGQLANRRVEVRIFVPRR